MSALKKTIAAASLGGLGVLCLRKCGSADARLVVGTAAAESRVHRWPRANGQQFLTCNKSFSKCCLLQLLQAKSCTDLISWWRTTCYFHSPLTKCGKYQQNLSSKVMLHVTWLFILQRRHGHVIKDASQQSVVCKRLISSTGGPHAEDLTQPCGFGAAGRASLSFSTFVSASF